MNLRISHDENHLKIYDAIVKSDFPFSENVCEAIKVHSYVESVWYFNGMACISARREPNTYSNLSNTFPEGVNKRVLLTGKHSKRLSCVFICVFDNQYRINGS